MHNEPNTMILKYIIILFIVLMYNPAFGQGDSIRISHIEARLKREDKKEYDSISRTILYAIENFPILAKNYEILDIKSDFSVLFAKLTQAANPNNDLLLGKSFTSVIKDEAKKILLIDLKDDARNGFIDIINKITSIPIIGNIISSNPVAALVTQVVTSASNFVTQKLEGCKICEKTLVYKDAISQRRIDSFSIKIQPFVSYYEEILFADRAFSSNLDIFRSTLKDKRAEVLEKTNSLKLLFVNASSQSTSTIIQFNKLMEISEENYRDVIDNDNTQKAYSLALTYKYYDINLKAYNEHFSKLFAIYLQTYIKSLLELRKYAVSNNYQTKEIDVLQIDIESFVNKYTPSKTINLTSDVTHFLTTDVAYLLTPDSTSTGVNERSFYVSKGVMSKEPSQTNIKSIYKNRGVINTKNTSKKDEVIPIPNIRFPF